jgi:unsaturated rhamnogalacturonyl hydrolase
MTTNVRRLITRLLPVTAVAGALIATAAIAPSALAGSSAPQSSAAIGPAAVDYSTLVADAEEKRASPSQLGGWGYTQGLFLWGTYLIYKRTGDKKYLTYMKSWADRFVDANGHLNNSFSSLDSMRSGTVLIALAREYPTDSRYRKGATQIRNRLKTFPRTKKDGDPGAFWHATSRQNQLWADGVFMVLPFLLYYGQTIGEADYANAEVVRNLNIYWKHLYDPQTGLLRHAYDESKSQSWANKTTGQAPEDWCRAIGWYSMTTIEALDILPANQPGRADLLDHMKTLVAGFKKWQDPASGRWFQLPAKPTLSGNWTETSCSSMYTYSVSRAVEKGYVDPSYKAVANRGYKGVLQRVSKTGDVSEICIGTNVGNQSYYLGRPRKTNDLHGLGAFLIMNEQLARTGGN